MVGGCWWGCVELEGEICFKTPDRKRAHREKPHGEPPELGQVQLYVGCVHPFKVQDLQVGRVCTREADALLVQSSRWFDERWEWQLAGMMGSGARTPGLAD